MSHPALISLGVYSSQRLTLLLISNFRRVLNAVCFLLGDSPTSEIYMPTFRNTPFIFIFYLPMKTTECSETSAYKFQTPGNHPRESIHLKCAVRKG